SSGIVLALSRAVERVRRSAGRVGMLHFSSRGIRGGVRAARAFLILATLYDATLGAAPVLAGSWVPKGPPGGIVLSTAVDPTNPLVVYAGTNNGAVYKSTNG